MKHILLWISLFFCGILLGQEDSVRTKRTLSNILNPRNNPEKPTLKISGFVNVQLFFDTRQVVDGREGLLELYPKGPDFAPDGKDFNARPNLSEAAMMSRITFSLSGPKIWKAETEALLEADFTGQTNNDINGFRLRHAYIRMKWEHFGFLVGQTWHPLNAIEVVPEVIGLNGGAPFRPFSRHPQIRGEAYIRNFRIMAVASFQRDYTSMGAQGVSNMYTRNAIMPGFDIQVQWKNGPWTVLIDGGVKQLKPAIATPTGYVADQKLTSFAATAAMRYDFPKLKIKAQAVWGQNMTEHIMLGGYVESGATALPECDITYANTSQISAFLDISTSFSKWNVGIIAAYAQNLGYQSEMADILYTEPGPEIKVLKGHFFGRGNDIAQLYRVSPRVTFRYKSLVAALETEYTAAEYGTPDLKGIVFDRAWIGNIRFLLSLTYYF